MTKKLEEHFKTLMGVVLFVAGNGWWWQLNVQKKRERKEKGALAWLQTFQSGAELASGLRAWEGAKNAMANWSEAKIDWAGPRSGSTRATPPWFQLCTITSMKDKHYLITVHGDDLCVKHENSHLIWLMLCFSLSYGMLFMWWAMTMRDERWPC